MASVSGSFCFAEGPLSRISQNVSKQWSQHRRSVGVASAVGLGLGLGLCSSKFPAIRDKNPGGALRNSVVEELQRARTYSSMLRSSLIASLSLSNVEEVVEPKTGSVFPSANPEGQQLTGVGLRKKSVFGLKNITVYAYGVYADPDSLKSVLGNRCDDLNAEEVGKDPGLLDDVTEKDVGLTVRLVIVYGKLKIGAIRSAFEGSVGSGLKKFSGEENKELLERFTSAFKDNMKLPRGTTIDISRLPGQVLQTKIDGEEIGSVQSGLLCRALFDLYLGDDAFDKSAREAIGSSLSGLLCS